MPQNENENLALAILFCVNIVCLYAWPGIMRMNVAIVSTTTNQWIWTKETAQMYRKVLS